MTLSIRDALVVGLGASGLAAAALLRQLGAHVRVYDRKVPTEPLPGDFEAYVGTPTPPRAAFEGIDTMVLSPGVPPAMFRAACRSWAPDATIRGELGLALEVTRAYHELPPLVLITGTNGKSTVTAMVGALLEAAGRRPFVGGNLGFPISERVACSLAEQCPWPSEMVLECSSYQLETLPEIPTQVAMILNVTPDHLDRYDSMDDYASTKGRIFQGLVPGGVAMLDDADAWTDKLAPSRDDITVARIGQPDEACIDGELLRVGDHPPIERSTLHLAGRHNAQNALFALRAVLALGVEWDAAVRGLAAFEGLPHRMQFVRELAGVEYFNDSKATNAASAIAGLGGLDRPFVLIAGGRSKGDDLEPLGALIRQKARALVTIGEAAAQFAALGGEALPTEHAASMKDAVEAAQRLAREGDIVVLSPACASFDQYRSYAHRGEAFVQAVCAL